MTAIKRLGETERTTTAAATTTTPASTATSATTTNAATNEFEGEIREFIRRDVSLRRAGAETPEGTAAEAGSQNLNSLIERVSGATVAEIDRVIAELQAIRSMLQTEGERVRREITGYAGLSQSSVATMKVIADTISQLKPGMLMPRND
jgi:hypothetical protein